MGNNASQLNNNYKTTLNVRAYNNFHEKNRVSIIQHYQVEDIEKKNREDNDKEYNKPKDESIESEKSIINANPLEMMEKFYAIYLNKN